MDEQSRLESLKIDLGITTTAFDGRLSQYMDAATAAIEQEGVSLDLSTFSDADLVVRYAAWLWRKRDTSEGMPRHLRWMLNNRLFSEKANG